MISWYYYGDKGWKYLFGSSSIKVYQGMYLGCIVLGSVASLGNVIDFSDIFRFPERYSRKKNDITIFESQGLAIWDLVLANKLYKIARENDLGTEIHV